MSSFNVLTLAVIQLISAWRDANALGGYPQISDELDAFVTGIEQNGEEDIRDVYCRSAVSREEKDAAWFLTNLLNEQMSEYWEKKAGSEVQDGDIPF